MNEISLDENDAVEKVMKDFDTSRDCRVDKDEFIDGVGRWLQKARGSKVSSDAGSLEYIDEFHMVCRHVISFFSVFLLFFTLFFHGLFSSLAANKERT